MTADIALDPKGAPTYRVLKAVVIILGVLIVLAFVALVVGGAMKFAGRRPVPANLGETAMLPPGAKILSIETSGNRVVVGLHTAEGDEVDIFDTDTGRPVARIKAAAGEPK